MGFRNRQEKFENKRPLCPYAFNLKEVFCSENHTLSFMGYQSCLGDKCKISATKDNFCQNVALNSLNVLKTLNVNVKGTLFFMQILPGHP